MEITYEGPTGYIVSYRPPRGETKVAEVANGVELDALVDSLAREEAAFVSILPVGADSACIPTDFEVPGHSPVSLLIGSSGTCFCLQYEGELVAEGAEAVGEVIVAGFLATQLAESD